MKKNALLVLIAIILVVIAIFLSNNFKIFSDSSSSSSNSNQLNSNQNSQPPSNNQASQENIIEMSSSGFSPLTLTIQQGETVIFKAMGSSNRWPASAMHPTHKVYPGSDIEKCGTSEESNIFDACKGIQQDETYEFTFEEVGTWRYHDHLQTSKTGTIIVQ